MQLIFVFHRYNASDENRPKVKLLEDKISIDCVTELLKIRYKIVF